MNARYDLLYVGGKEFGIITDFSLKSEPPRKPFPHECNAWCEPEEMGEGRQHCDITYCQEYGTIEQMSEGFRRQYPHLNLVHLEEAKKAPPPGSNGRQLESADGLISLVTKEQVEGMVKMRCYRYWVRLTPYTWIVPPIKLVGLEEEDVEDAIDPYTG